MENFIEETGGRGYFTALARAIRPGATIKNLHHGGDGKDRRGALSSIDIVLSPNLRTSSIKTSRLLKERGGGYGSLLLNVPAEMEEIVVELAAENISYGEFVDEIMGRDLIPEPEGSWEYGMGSIMEALPHLARRYPHLSIRCYGSREDEFASTKIAVKVARLILRTILTGKVEVEEWRRTLRDALELHRKASEREAERILEKTGEKSICVSDLGGRRFMKTLIQAGLDVKIHYVERFYHFTPLAILRRKMARGSVEDRELEELVRSHVEYVRNYIYRFRNRDRAHYEWEYEKIPWLRHRINKEEIKLLDSLIYFESVNGSVF